MRWKKSLLIDAILKYHLRNESDEENSSEPFHQGKRVLRKTHQSLLHQEKRVLRKIHPSLSIKEREC